MDLYTSFGREIAALLLLFGGLLLAKFLSSSEKDAPFWKSQPAVGPRKERFATTRVLMRSISKTRDLVFQGYKKVSISAFLRCEMIILTGHLKSIPRVTRSSSSQPWIAEMC
jgi:hypothetical protein